MVTITDSVTNTIVNIRYLPINGITNDVDGIISIRTRRKKLSDNSIDTESVTFSPLSDGI